MNKKRAGILLAEGFEEIEAVIPIDLLRRGGVEVLIIGVTHREVTGAHGITITSDVLLENVDPQGLDAVILPGGMPGSSNLAESHGAAQLIKKLTISGKIVAAICAAPAIVLSPLGVLDGKEAVCYPGMESHAPQSAFKDKGVLVDGTLVTAQGPGKSAEFALALLEMLQGSDTARQVGTKSLFTS